MFGLIFEMINRSIAGKAEEMRVLLISPNILGVRGGINRIQPPLGLGYVASFARQAGHEVFVRDTALEGYGNQIELDNGLIRIGETDDQIRAFIRKINPAKKISVFPYLFIFFHLVRVMAIQRMY